ncbi:MAG TPA: NADH-quinone oxidoreductase subunit I [bacterium]|nr:NADH-quinone oxidoreductase subunit I [bacterium]
MSAVAYHLKGFWSLIVGLKLTWQHLWKKPVTLQYPDETWDLPLGAKGQLFNRIEDCIGCLQCARVCPVDCIAIETAKAGKDEDLGTTSDGQKKKLHVLRFDIDFAKCCYCALCTVPCPTECLYMTKEYENSVYNRDNLIYHYATYSPEEVERIRASVDGKTLTVGIHP